MTTHTAKSAVYNKSVTPHEDVYAMSKRTELLAQDPRSLERSAGPLSSSYGAGGRARGHPLVPFTGRALHGVLGPPGDVHLPDGQLGDPAATLPPFLGVQLLSSDFDCRRLIAGRKRLAIFQPAAVFSTK